MFISFIHSRPSSPPILLSTQNSQFHTIFYMPGYIICYGVPQFLKQASKLILNLETALKIKVVLLQVNVFYFCVGQLLKSAEINEAEDDFPSGEHTK